MNDIAQKICFKCHQKKELNEFYKHPGMKDGHLNKCKECNKKDVSKNYADNVDYYKEYDAMRNDSKKRKEKALEYQTNRRKREPIKYKARTAVSNAIRDKRLFKQPCQECGSTNSQAHHEDYSKPLNVVWLCFTCHRKEHNQFKYLD